MSAEAQPAEAAAPAQAALLDRALAAYPVAIVYLLLSMLYCWQASKHVAPFVYSDELQWAELSRAIATTGHAQLRLQDVSAPSLYAYLIAPAWWLQGTQRAYDAIKYFDSLLMAASFFPAYGLARMLVSRPLALYAAAGTATVPALIYSSMLIPEPLAYPYAVLCFFLLARALERRTRGRVALAALFILAAPLVRGQLAVLIPGAALAAVVYAATSDEGRRVLRSWTWRERVGALVLALGLAIFLNAYATNNSPSWQIGTHFSGRMIELGVWAFGAFAIGVGVLPAIAALAWILGADQREPRERAFLAVAVGAVVVFGLYVAVKASYLSTTLATRVEERNLIYLTPIAFVGAAAALSRLRVRIAAAIVAAAAIAYALSATPYQMADRLYSDAPGLAILSAANRAWAWNQDFAQNVFLWMVVVSTLVLVVPALLRRFAPQALPRAAVLGTAAVVCVASLAWTVTAEVTAANAAQNFSERAIGALPGTTWVDARTDGALTLYLGQRINENSLYPLEFWNQSIGEVWSLDASTPPPGPTITPNLAKPDGTISAQRAVRWAIGDNGVGFVGIPVERHGATVLFRVTPPLRITSAVSGVYDDNWMGSDASFAQYSTPGGGAGIARLTISRAGATGREPPTRVQIRLGPVRIDENGQPQIARVLTTRTWLLKGRDIRTFELPARPPYRIEIHVTRTFRPTDYGVPDSRELGAQVAQTFVPNR